MRLPKGTLEFEVIRDGKPATWTGDCVELKLLCEELEEKHGVVSDGEKVKVTAEFLSDLASRLSALGIPGCTSTAAHTVYHVVNVQFAAYNDRLGDDIEKLLG